MKKQDLQDAVSTFEMVANKCRSLYVPDKIAALPLCEIYLTKSARLVRMCVDEQNLVEVEAGSNQDVQEEDVLRPLVMFSQSAVRSAAQKLLAAVTAEDRDGTMTALEEMGISALGLTPEQQFFRLETIAGCVTGRARLVPLIELSIFAVELGDFKRATKYAAEAHQFDPEASELHDLYTVEGLAALSEGDVSKAIGYLTESIKACTTNEYACLSCGIRAPNVMLAEKLLEQGRQEEVVEYLIQCQDVWDYHSKEIAAWIGAIQRGESPEFLASGTLGAMNHPCVQIGHLCARARILEDEPRSSTLQSKADALAGRARLRAEYKQTGGAPFGVLPIRFPRP